MPAGLVEQPVARVDQQDRQIGGRRAGRHVARVLLMSGRIRQDEPPPWRFEETICDVDRHTLFAFRLESIDQQRVIDTPFDGAKANRVTLQRQHHVVGDGAALEQQPADQGRFAVIDAAAGQDAQKGIRHQK